MTAYELTPSDEINKRIKRLQEEMAKKEIDLAFVIQNVDLFYFSGSIQRGYLLVPSQTEMRSSLSRRTMKGPSERLP